MKRLVFIAVVSFSTLVSAVLFPALAGVSVRTVDFLGGQRLSVNAAGPVLLKMDETRNRLIVANTLTSSVTIVDCATGAVANIAAGARALQHLKAEALTFSARTGDVYLIGAKCLIVAHPNANQAETIPTTAQFESIAVDETTGNAFLAGRESREIGLYKPGAKKLKLVEWLEHREDLINLNATPPPPIRRVVADGAAGEVIAVDGFTSTLFVFDAKSAKLLRSRPIALAPGGRWHFAGYDAGAHELFLVIETAERKVIQAARIDAAGTNDLIVPLPEFTEGVGVLYNSRRREVYIPYDNHPSVHVVDFNEGGVVTEIAIPSYGNDASALDAANDRLYIGSWAHGEVDVIDLAERKLVRRIENLGIIPHMFAMAFNPKNNTVYFPKGGSAVNGAFGAAVTALDPATGRTSKIHTGWAPIDLIEVPARGSFFVFNSEDEFAEVRSDGTYDIHQLPFDYPIRAAPAPGGDVYLSYGPHQSYWPVVYIWGAKNGVLGIGSKDLSYYDRRIPRQAHRIVLDENGVAYMTQNNWGEEEQFVGVLKDPVRLFDIGQRIPLGDKVTREITQRLLAYDPLTGLLYLARVAETDTEPSILQAIDPDSNKVVRRLTLGLTAADLEVSGGKIYVSNFDSHTVTVVDQTTYAVDTIETGKEPLGICAAAGDVFVITHAGNTLERLTGERTATKIPNGTPDNVFPWGDRVVITSHGTDALYITEFDPKTKKFALLHKESYPFGETRFDTGNVSFYIRGQFGDAVFSITEGRTGADGKLWVTDFPSGKAFILER
jgi:YVTN family beta-propeller protein